MLMRVPPISDSTPLRTGTRMGDEVVMAYHSVGEAVRAMASKHHPVPLRSLVQLHPRDSDPQKLCLGPENTLCIQFRFSESSPGGQGKFLGARIASAGAVRAGDGGRGGEPDRPLPALRAAELRVRSHRPRCGVRRALRACAMLGC